MTEHSPLPHLSDHTTSHGIADSRGDELRSAPAGLGVFTDHDACPRISPQMHCLHTVAAVPSGHPALFTDQRRLAMAAYLARFKGFSRERTESDPRCFLAWCAERGLDPLAARRLEHSPAEHVRRPTVPAESPSPWFTHLQFEASLTAA